MHLIQILLPLSDDQGRRFAAGKYRKVQALLSQRFKGLTAYSRTVAEGLWKDGPSLQRDEIIVYEVMTNSLNVKWWKNYQKHLQTVFAQESIVVRALKITVI